MAARSVARTVLELRIRQRRMTFEEFTEQLEVFARENNEAGTLSTRHVQRLCTGKLPPDQLRPATVRLLEKFFDSPIEQLLSTPGMSVSSTVRVSQKPPSRGVDRRDFIGVTAGTALGMTATFRPRLSSRAGENDWRHLVDRTARLRRLDNYLGGRDTYSLYASELASTVEYVRSASCTPNIRAALVGVVSEQAQLAGWAAFDAGMHAEAKEHYSDSLKAAKEAKSSALTGNALAFLAYQEVSTTGPNVGLAEASFTAAEKDATPRVRALLLERKAWTYAVAGDHQSTEQALARARSAVRSDSDRPEPDWVFWVDENEIEIMAGRCWAELRRPLRAVSVLDAALAKFDDAQARDKALYMTSLAHALIDAKEIERAALIIQESARLAWGIGSVRPIDRIQGVAHRLREFKSSAAVSRVLEQVGN
jgi:tetratricopeptide (TPR) repeat protein